MRHEDPAILRSADGRRPFAVERRAPGGALADRVAHLWTVAWDLPSGAVHEQEVLSAPALHLTVEGDAVELHGVVTRRFVRSLRGAGRVLGCRFRPGGITAACRVPLPTLVNRAVPAEQVLGPWVVELRRAAHDPARVERLLREHLPPPGSGARLVDDAVALVVDDLALTRVDELARRLGTTPRTLQRRFEQHLGVGPKWVLQRQRITDALASAEAGHVDWALLAAELGFADQPHLSRVFRELVGVSPAAYERRVPT